MTKLVAAYVRAGFSLAEAIRMVEATENSTALVVVPGTPPGKNLSAFLRNMVGQRTKLIVVSQPGDLGPGAFEQLLRASMPDVERKLRIIDGGDSIADAVSSAEANHHYTKSHALEVYADHQLAANFTQEVKDGGLNFDPSLIMVHPTEIPTDDAGDIQQAVQADDLNAMHRVLDPHVFSDATALQRYKDALRAQAQEGVVREFLTDIAPSRELGIMRLDAILQGELGDAYDDLEYLGSGRNGSAYRTSDGFILKVTTDKAEVGSAARLKGLECEYIHHIYEVLFTEDPNVWMILQEGGLEKLPKQYCEEFDTAMEALDVIGAGHHLRVGDAHALFETMMRSEHTDLCVLVAEVMKKFDIGGMLREMAALGLTGDFHSGNIMLREGCPVLTDLGTPGDDPGDMNESATSGVVTAFHGSNRRIDQPSTVGAIKSNGSDFGPGMYFAINPRDAAEHGFNLYKAQLNVKNPFVVSLAMSPVIQKVQQTLGIDDEYMQDGMDNPWHTLMELVRTMVEVGQTRWSKVTAILKGMGHDGIIVPHAVAKATPGNQDARGDYVIIFDVSQISSWNETSLKKASSGDGGQVNELVGAQAAPQAGPRSQMRGSNSSAWAGGKMVLSKPEAHVPEDENESERDHALDVDIVGGGLNWGSGLNKRGY